MNRGLAVILVLAFAAAMVGEARQRPSIRGVIVEGIEKGSAPGLAGVKPGDELLSWTRAASVTTAAAQGEFRTPFDAREFEMEQLPRGGTIVTAMRNGAVVEARLIPGFWGVTARPAFSDADLAAYESGKAQLTERPLEALATWQPLIDRMGAAGDRGNAAWLMTRVASSLVARDQLQPADELFDRAAVLFKDPANPTFEAMVWEAKGLAYRPAAPRVSTADNTTERPPKIATAVEAHERARSLRLSPSGGRTLASAESEVSIVAAFNSAPNFFYAAAADGTRPTLARADQFFKDATAFVAGQAPGSFALGRSLVVMSNVIMNGHSSAGSREYSLLQAQEARAPALKQAWASLEVVAPVHDMLRSVLDTLSLYSAPHLQTEDARREYERIQRRRIEMGQQIADRKLVESATIALAGVKVRQGDIAAGLSLRDELLRTGTTYSSIADGLLILAQALNSQGARDAAISVLEDLLKGISPPWPTALGSASINLSQWYSQRGDLAGAERVISSFLLRSDGGQTSNVLLVRLYRELAAIAIQRGDLAAAEAWAQRALVNVKAMTGNVGETLGDQYDLLGQIALKRGDSEKAAEYLKLAIEQERLIKDPTDVQRRVLANRMVRAATTRADAEKYSREELDLARKSSPGTTAEAGALWNYSLHQAAADAERTMLEELALRRRLEPGSQNLVRSLSRLGDLAQVQGEGSQALTYYEEALALQEDRRLRARNDGGAWSAGGVPIPVEPYVNVVRLRLAEGDLPAAFNVAERSRGQSLLAMLRGRDVFDAASIPPALYEERRQREAEYEQKQAALEAMSSVRNAGAVAAAHEDLDKLQLRLKDLDHRITALNPRIAAFEQPAPMSLSKVRAGLDPGTVLLSYVTGSSRTYLFVVTAAADTRAGESGVTVHELPVGEAALRECVNAFRRLIGWDADATGSDRSPMFDRARALYDTLVRPAEPQIARAYRLLLSVDGPLQTLPFGALVRDLKTGPQFLIEWKPLHTTPSMGVYLETLERRRPASATGQLAAFGDPAYVAVGPSSSTLDPEVESLLRAGGTLAPLPGTRREVKTIAGLFAPRSTAFLGAAATETQAKALDKSLRFIHFAVHGVLDEEMPLNSALMFTTPAPGFREGDNGALQAWEIFRYVRIDADLVTLSACESGLGKEVAGEGLIGLTRAFQYAGARTVAASLWKVADRPTAELMTRFYENLRRGEPKDQALRNAQLALIHLDRQPGARVNYSSPAHWAAFTLTGDWK